MKKRPLLQASVNAQSAMMKTFNTVVLLLVLATTGCVYLNGNFRTVENGQVYRSGQLSPAGLERRLEKHTIRTVVSLRGPSPEENWYIAEKDVCDRLDVQHVDLPWTQRAVPTPESLLELILLYEEGPRPVLVHCQGGTHRAAVAAAVYRLLNGATTEEAREEFKFFFNNAPIGALLDLYDGSDLPFRQWAVEVYPELYASIKADY